MKQHIMMVSGEPSGDRYAAYLMQHWHQIAPVHFSGMGGLLSQQAGMHRYVKSDHLAIMGWTQVLFQYRNLRKALNRLKYAMCTQKPDALILIDYPGFNFRLAHTAHQLNIPIFYFIPPQIWAWKKNRIKSLKKWAQHVIVLLPFEKDYYDQAGIPCTLLEHPLLKQYQPQPQITPLEICLLPGSRQQEIKRLLPLQLAAFTQLQKQYPLCRARIAKSPNIPMHYFTPWQKQLSDLHIPLVEGEPAQIASSCQIALVTSGTVTLEIALIEKPMLVIYRLNWLNEWIAKKIVKVPYFSLCNLIAGQKVAIECMGPQATAHTIAKILATLLHSPPSEHTLKQVRKRLEHAPHTNIRTLIQSLQQHMTTHQHKQYSVK